jgi:putative chitinase
MRKKYLANQFAFWVLFLPLFLIFFACQKNEFEQKNNHSKKNSFSIEFFSSDGLNMQSRGEGSAIYDSINNFTIHLDNVVAIRSDSTHWLTFLITREDETGLLENLVLRWDNNNGHYEPFLFQYNLTPEDVQLLGQGRTIPQLDEKTNIEILAMKVAPCYEITYAGLFLIDGVLTHVWIKSEVPCGDEEGGGGNDGSDSSSDNSSNGNDSDNGSEDGGFYSGWGPGGYFVDTNPFLDNGYDEGSDSGGGSGGNDGGDGSDDDMIDPPHNDSGHTIVRTLPVLEPIEPEEPEEPEETEDCNTSKGDLIDMFPNANDDDMELLAQMINDLGAEFGIDTKAELQHFLAQAGHETGGFTDLNVTENLNYSASRLVEVWPSRFSQTDPSKLDPDNYDNNPQALANVVYCCRLGNGNEASGDGWTYRGRGIFQLTGKDNYDAYHDFLTSKGIGWMYSGPSDLENSTHAILSALWYFQANVLNKMNIDGNTDCDKVTDKVNRYTGPSSRAARETQLNNAKAEIDCL